MERWIVSPKNTALVSEATKLKSVLKENLWKISLKIPQDCLQNIVVIISLTIVECRLDMFEQMQNM